MVSRASPIEVPSDDEDDFVKLKSWYEQQALSEEEDDARGACGLLLVRMGTHDHGRPFARRGRELDIEDGLSEWQCA